jgi:hypothetical protein
MPNRSQKGTDHEGTRSFDQVLDAELEAIRDLRKLRGREQEPFRGATPVARAHDANLLGLAFSGGGIRSATFNLGVIQGLARLGLLSRFDLLSVNSGGGYIGGWLEAWIHRLGMAGVVRALAGDACRDDEPAGGPQAAAAPAEPEPSEGHERKGAVEEGQEVEAGPVRFLRRFSNYLTPQVGLFTADTWTVVATYARNLLLNLSVLVLLLGVILLSPRLLLLLARVFDGTDALNLFILAAGFLGIAIFSIGLSLAQIFPSLALGSSQGTREWPWFTRQGWVQALVVVPLFVSAWFGALWLWYGEAGALAERAAEGDLSLARWSGRHLPGYAATGLTGPQHEVVAWALLTAILYGGLWLFAAAAYAIVARAKKRSKPADSGRIWRAVLLGAPIAGAVGGTLIWTLTLLARAQEGTLAAMGYLGEWNLIHINVWKAPSIILVFILTAFVHTGLMGRAFPEALREWWSRLGAWMLIYAITWLGMFGIAIYGPILLVILGTIAAGGLSVGWLGSTLTGVIVGRESDPSKEEKPSWWRRLVIALAPQIFIVGLLALVALGLHAILRPAAGGAGETAASAAAAAPGAAEETLYRQAGPPGEATGEAPLVAEAAAVASTCDYFWPPEGTKKREIFHCHTQRLWNGTRTGATLGLLGLLAVVSLILSWRVDINEFSMHLFYRNRLIRAYLGASSLKRQPQPFTGFDPGDDLPLADLTPANGYDGPYPIHNATLNLVAGKELAWQERKGASWVFTPLDTGFDVYAGEGSANLEPHGYRPTAGYRQTERGLTLGTAMAISGAAASPNMGEGTTPAMAFLLTVFNVRLGWWLGNPRHKRSWFRMGPQVGVFALLSELFGHTDEESRYVYLSDGGHFDNLGLYELIRRRCRLIVLADAGADAELTFKDVGNSIRKCCTDFGVEIDIDPGPIRTVAETGNSAWHCAVGTIRYDTVDPEAPTGTLVYFKASLTGDEPVDAQAYKSGHAAFPHEPTSDQWFGESQFESYRKLGEHVAIKVLSAAGKKPHRLALDKLSDGLQKAWKWEQPKKA